MIDKQSVILKKLSYDKIFIIDDRNKWENFTARYSKENDLILCVDFALKKQLIEEGYQVEFLDHLINRDVMQYYNFGMHDFLDKWHRSPSGESLLMYNDFNIGDALLLNVYNDITYFCHFFFNLLAIKHINYKTLDVCVSDKLIVDVLNKLNIKFNAIPDSNSSDRPVYYFPISKWMNEKVYRTSLRSKVKDIAALSLDFIFGIYDAVFKTKRRFIYIQGYYPTFGVINKLKADKSIGLILGNYTNIKSVYKERRISFIDPKIKPDTSIILNDFEKAKKISWKIDEYELGDYLQEIILPIVANNISIAVSRAQSIEKFFAKNTIALMVPVTNLWLNNRLIMDYCKNHNIPVFMIINGLLNVDYLNDAKDSDWVNCYSESLKQDYFKGRDNAVPLGDPRMDAYVTMGSKKINRGHPTITIGAAGFGVNDLNSYLAYEFDFLFDILKAIELLRGEGLKNNVVLKVRANGYADQYRSFINEYFPELQVRIEQNSPFIDVIKQADLYITFYSQTIFEASTIGIPTIYYKNDTQFTHAPFDGDSELITATDIEDLKRKMTAFYSNDPCFEKFTDKNVMERYIGKLDGKNTDRNTDFIYSLIKQKRISN